MFLPFLLAAAEIEIPKTWVYQESRDAVTDMSGATALLISKDHDAGLALRCETASEERPLVLIFSLAQNRSLYSASNRVTVRFDDAKSVDQEWGFKYGVAYVPEGRLLRQLLLSIQNSKLLRVRVPDTDGELNDRTFEVDGSGETFSRVLTACGKPNYLNPKSQAAKK